MYKFAIKPLKNRQKLDILKNILLFLLVEIPEKVLFLKTMLQKMSLNFIFC